MSQEVQTTADDEKPKLWTCNDSYRFQVPRPDGDPWEIVLEPLLQKDKMQCDAWKDEVQNLLIFAGLFSAVVTTFVVESLKDLQEDPAALSAALLSRILAQLKTNGSTSFEQPLALPVFSPSSVTVRVNLFWFSSLILSLTTVLIGIISLQWIREHQQYPGCSPKEVFAIFTMRAEALDRWHVPRIFASLPIILQVAVVLFFAGVADFLRVQNVAVAAPVIILIGLTLTFMVATTALPTLQGFALSPSHIYGDGGLSAPCPYKSPQSEIFRHVAASSKTIFRLGCRLFKGLNTIVDESRELFHTICHWGAYQPPTLVLRPLVPSTVNLWKQKTWITFDKHWLILRDAYAQSIAEENVDPDCTILPYHLRRWQQRNPAPLFDAAQGLKKASYEMGGKPTEAFLFAEYWCYNNLSESVVGPQSRAVHFVPDIHHRNRYLHWLLERNSSHKLSTGFVSDLVDKQLDMQFLNDENMFKSICIIDPSHTFSRDLSQHFAELHFRLLGALYSCPRPLRQSTVYNLKSPVMFDPEILYNLDIYNRSDQPFTHQWALTVATFFKAINMHDPEDMQQSFHIHPLCQKFMQYFWTAIVNDRWIDISHPATIDEATSTMSSIEVTLIARSTDSGPRPDLLFYFASIYMKWFKMRNPYYRKLRTVVDKLLPLMRDYQELMDNGHNPDLELQLGGGGSDNSGDVIFSDRWWSFLRSTTTRTQKARSSRKHRHVHFTETPVYRLITHEDGHSEKSLESTTAIHSMYPI